MKYIHLKDSEIPLYRGKLVVIISNDTELIKKHLPSFSEEKPYAHAISDNWKGYVGYFINTMNKHGFTAKQF
jgi:hypothetical protein